ncbi:MAG TPA: hypothetical protein VEA37_03370 [Flavobacterium sp.]|nr:hypothetical protein [Flavobacterium sp.]
MTQLFTDYIAEVYFALFEYPGAWIHWLLKKKKLTFKTIVERYAPINILLTLLLYALVVIALWQIIK